MGSRGGDTGPSAEQQAISAEQLRIEEERLALQRSQAEREQQQLSLLSQQIQQQTVSNEELLASLREQNVAAQQTTADFGRLLETAVNLQQTEASLQAQEATRAEGRQDLQNRRVSTSLLSTQRDIQERSSERLRRRRAGATAPAFTSRERAASLLQR